MTTERIDRDALLDLAIAVLTRHGMNMSDARTVADVLVWADLSGYGSHGVSRLERYLGFAERGDLDLRAHPEKIGETGAMARFEGHRCAGAVAMAAALPDAVARTRKYANSTTFVTGTTHIGAAGYYVDKLAAEGLVGVVMAAGGPLMAYHGTAGPAVATAPLAIGVPGGEHGPLVLDMASSVAARGKIRQAEAAGEPIPIDWALDNAGRPTTDPAAASVVRPLGGPKGSGLALMIEVISSILPGASILAPALAPDAGKRHRQNATIIALDIAALSELHVFTGAIDALVDGLKNQPRAEGVDAIRMPGERSARTRRERIRDGIPLKPALLEKLRRLSD